MADLKISQLNAGDPAQTNDEIPIARSGANYKITAGSISALPPTTAGANQVIYVDSAGTSLDGDANFVYTSTGNLGIGTASPAAKLDVVGTAQISSNLTLSGGTANGVLYLNGSKVATSGSALTFNGTNFGLNNDGYLIFASPDATVEEKSRIQWLIEDASEMNSIRVNRANAFGESTMGFYTRGGGPSALRYLIGTDGTSVWSVAGSELMRLTSTGLGIGTSSPSSKLNVVGTMAVPAANFKTLLGLEGTDAQAAGNGAGVTFSGRFDGTTERTTFAQVAGIKENSTSGNFAGALAFYSRVNGGGLNEVGRFDSSGNLGLGVTPSAWSSFKAVQVGSGSLASTPTGQNLSIAANAYFDGTNWKYVGSAVASEYRQNGGEHFWSIAGAGTAGNNISWTTAMTLNASGNLGLGATTTTGGRLVISQSNATQPAIYLPTDESTIQGPGTDTQIKMGSNLMLSSSNQTTIAAKNASGVIVFQTGSTPTERARITSGGDVGIGTTSPATKLEVNGTTRSSAYNTTAGTISVAPSTATTFFTPSSSGLYLARVYLAGNATQTWDAVIIFAFNATNILVVNQTNSTNVSTTVSGTNVQVTQIGASTFTFSYEVIRIG